MNDNLNRIRTFNFPIKVYYEDTDAEGVVYYANYLKFIERARTEMINVCDTSLKILHKDYDSRFIVKICNLDFIKSAHLEDVLEVKTSLKKISNASFVLDQNIFHNEKNYPFLIKEYDSKENGFKYHVKLFKINYESMQGI